MINHRWVLLSKAGRQTSFHVSPIVRQTMVVTLGFGESEIIQLLDFRNLSKSYFNKYIKSSPILYKMI